jgi:hypothetical protein
MAHWPTFLIVGAAKAGTTSLYHYLGQHPDVFVSSLKEPNFFAFKGRNLSFSGPGDTRCNKLSRTSVKAYQQLFSSAGEAKARGEASPSSLYYPQASDRIHQYVPDIRIIVSLRDPVNRSYSNYLMMVMQGREPCRDFSKALERELPRLAAGWSYFWGYTQLGFYYKQLKRYYRLFSQDQIHVCLLDDLANRPLQTVQSLYGFIGVDRSYQPDLSTQHNPSGAPESKILHWLLYHAGVGKKIRSLIPDGLRERLACDFAPYISRVRAWKKELMYGNLRKPLMSPATRKNLQAIYREDILRLQDLIDRDLSHWLQHND